MNRDFPHPEVEVVDEDEADTEGVFEDVGEVDIGVGDGLDIIRIIERHR